MIHNITTINLKILKLDMYFISNPVNFFGTPRMAKFVCGTVIEY